MKLNLLINNAPNIRSGFVNLDPYANGEDDRIVGDFKNLGEHCEQAECQELVALDILDKFDVTEVESVLDHWLSRLAKGGVATLNFPDLQFVTYKYSMGEMSIEDANVLLHGPPTRLCSLALSQVSQTVRSKGFSIVQQRYDGAYALIKIRRDG